MDIVFSISLCLISKRKKDDVIAFSSAYFYFASLSCSFILFNHSLDTAIVVAVLISLMHGSKHIAKLIASGFSSSRLKRFFIPIISFRRRQMLFVSA